MIRSDTPADNLELRRLLFQGEIFRLPATPASRLLVARALDHVRQVFGHHYRSQPSRLSFPDNLARLRQLKDRVYNDSVLHRLVVDILCACGFAPGETLFDPPRLRAVIPGAHAQPRAGAAYSAHRDTWYANPPCQINWWIPLADAGRRETFSFFPDYFQQAIKNSSSGFDYERWVSEVGFGNSLSQDQSSYPSANERLLARARALPFACRKAGVLLFSAAHLHRTNAISSGLTRFSIDFRTADRRDIACGLGAPDPDNESRGSALCHYLPASPLAVGRDE